jgi:hypothetical protein
VYKSQSWRLPRPDESGLAMTREVTAAVKNTGKTKVIVKIKYKKSK